MIYDPVDQEAPIRQGDIFFGLPRLDLSLSQMVAFRGEEIVTASWRDLAKEVSPQEILVAVRPVAAIVATQDCDAIRGRDITLCEIGDFADIEAKAKNATSPKSLKSIITQHARINQKWYYLPPGGDAGFTKKKAVDFRMTLRLPRTDLEDLSDMRICRLNEVAAKHFRERIGEFFRRYPYDEWYALEQEELAAYQNDCPGVVPFPWQEKTGSE